jgi:hypothetical protein
MAVLQASAKSQESFHAKEARKISPFRVGYGGVDMARLRARRPVSNFVYIAVSKVSQGDWRLNPTPTVNSSYFRKTPDFFT